MTLRQIYESLINAKRSLQIDGCLASEFDNIFYKPVPITVTEKGILHFYKKVETFEKARLISDHVPVYVRFVVK